MKFLAKCVLPSFKNTRGVDTTHQGKAGGGSSSACREKNCERSFQRDTELIFILCLKTFSENTQSSLLSSGIGLSAYGLGNLLEDSRGKYFE
jgi:hypothetical protein